MTRERATPVLELDDAVAAALRARLPSVAEHTVEVIREQVPGYGAMTGPMGQNIVQAVQFALGAFLQLAERAEDADPSTPLAPARDGAYALGRGEARSGRTMDALLAAYRIGARVAWRDLSTVAVDAGLLPSTVAQFAELVFDYIDQLSAASVAGHTDELETTGRVRQRHLERLAEALVAGASPDVLAADAERAEWAEPGTLTAVLLPAARLRGALSLLSPRTLTTGLPGDAEGTTVVLLVPDADRPHLLRLLAGRPAVVGPARAWTAAESSYRRACQARALLGDDALLDTEQHLPALVLTADPEALADLRARALAPLSALKPGTADRLAETLRLWLLHHGRREEVAEALVVHPQTVRYRMGQLRELYGDRLTDPEQVLELTLALAVPPTR